MPSITKQGTVSSLHIVKHQVLTWPYISVKVKLQKDYCVLILENDDVT